uniref:mitochondrial mRNA pseudouridine synthase RPUSD3 isoform X1 n=2 Tax=Myxine glutinosa TaxID=7769 RepID=UPI00358E62BF
MWSPLRVIHCSTTHAAYRLGFSGQPKPVLGRLRYNWVWRCGSNRAEEPMAPRASVHKVELDMDVTSREDVLAHLVKNVLFRKGPLIALNKPIGLPLHDMEDDQVNVTSLLNDLAHMLSASPDLHIVKSAPKEQSGVLLLSECYENSQKLQVAFKQARKQRQLLHTYWAVVIGIPNPPEGHISIALSEQLIGSHRLMVPVMKPSKGNLLKKEARKTYSSYQVRQEGKGYCLLEMSPLTAQKHQLQVHVTKLLCAVLGDRMYGGRVRNILGHSTPIDPEIALQTPQELPPAMLSRLSKRPGPNCHIPLHLHLFSLSLPSIPSRQKGHHITEYDGEVIKAPPPAYFLQTLRLLGLAKGIPEVQGLQAKKNQRIDLS